MLWVILYALGVAIGIWRGDARLSARLGYGLLWPVGPIAFVITVLILIAVAAIALPFRPHAVRAS